MEIYQSANFFMVRFANLPFKFLTLAETGDFDALFQFYQSQPLFREAIAIASPDFEQSLAHDIQDKEKALVALTKYLIRMCTRATPFGCFSSIGWGYFSDMTTIAFNPSLLKKETSLSLSILSKLIQKMHAKKEVVRHLKVLINPQLVWKRGRVFLNRENYIGENYLSIKRTNPLELLRSLASHPILYSELEEELIKNFPQEKQAGAAEYLWKIFDNKYLISELVDPYQFSMDSPRFFKRIAHLEAADFFGREEPIEELKNQQPDIKKPFKVDCFHDDPKCLLHKNVQSTVQKAASILMRLASRKNLPQAFLDFHSYFIEEYGTARLVPLSELMNCKLVQKLFEGELKNLTIDPIQGLVGLGCLDKGLDLGSILSSLPALTEDQREKLIPSLELYFELQAESTQKIDEGHFSLVIKGLSHQAGATFGRFLYHWDRDKQEELRQFVRKDASPNVLFVEPTFFSDSTQAAEVSVGLILREFQLPMIYHHPDASIVTLDDLFIGADLTKIYIYSKRLDKELYFSPSIMTNPSFMPPPVKFLLLLSQYQFSSVSEWMLETFSNSAFTPRLFYENIILSPAKWECDYLFLNLQEGASKEEVEVALSRFFQEYRVPILLQVSHADNRLSLNRGLKRHLDIIVSEFIKHKRLTFQEQTTKEESLFAGDIPHFCEFVVPLTKIPYSPPKQTVHTYPTTEQVSLEDRTFLPGSEWLYGKIFISENDANIFLSSTLYPFMQQLESKYSVRKWFFIRYFEKSFHIRIRIHADPELLSVVILPELTSWISEQITKGNVQDFQIFPYQKEIERYGGPQCHRFAEDFFFADSLCTMQLLSCTTWPFPDFIIASFGIIHILLHFYPSPKEALQILLFDGKWLDGMRPYSKTGVHAVQDLFFGGTGDPSLKGCFESSSQALTALFSKVEELEKEKALWGNRENLINNLIHLHCNRFLGISRDLEEKARAAAFYFLDKLEKRKNAYTKNS